MNALYAAIAALLATDATFVAAMQALNLGAMGTPATPIVLEGNRPMAAIGQENLPAWVMEIGDNAAAAVSENGDGNGLTVGSYEQGFQGEILLALVWHQQEATTAHVQRRSAFEALVKLFLRNPAANDTCVNCWVAGYAGDRQANHPTHVAAFRVAANFIVSR